MRITWDEIQDRPYSSGLSQGVLYPENAHGVAWNGLVSVTESEGLDLESFYFDGRKYSVRSRSQAFSGTISAFTYPDEFEPSLGIAEIFTAQNRRPFSFSYRTEEAIHIVYNAILSSSDITYSSDGETIEPVAFEWPFITQPVKIPGGKDSSHVVILTANAPTGSIGELEDVIYGSDEIEALLPPVESIIEIFESHTTLRITNNGDGTWTAEGPDTAITMLDSETFQIAWPSVIFIDGTTYQISSL